VPTHLCPLCAGYVLLGKRKHGLLFERSVFCQDLYKLIEHGCESFWIAAEFAPVAEPMDRFIVRSRDGVMLLLHGGHDLRRLGLGPFEKQRPENQVFAFVMRMQDLEYKPRVRTDAKRRALIGAHARIKSRSKLNSRRNIVWTRYISPTSAIGACGGVVICRPSPQC